MYLNRYVHQWELNITICVSAVVADGALKPARKQAPPPVNSARNSYLLCSGLVWKKSERCLNRGRYRRMRTHQDRVYRQLICSRLVHGCARTYIHTYIHTFALHWLGVLLHSLNLTAPMRMHFIGNCENYQKSALTGITGERKSRTDWLHSRTNRSQFAFSVCIT
jgi:hypothetical protein